MICNYSSCDKEITGKQRKFCSYECKNKFHVTEFRRNIKRRLVEHYGGSCVWCGYNNSVAALQFHHPDDNKEFGIAAKGNTRSFEVLITEADKCILICANCHAEEHEKLRQSGKATAG